MASRMTAELKKEIVTQMIVCDENHRNTNLFDGRYSIKKAYKMGLIHRLDAFTRLYDLLKKHSHVETFVSVTNFDSCVRTYLDL